MCKKYQQEHPRAKNIVVDNPTLGKIETTLDEMYKKSTLSIREVSDINKARSDKKVYCHDVQIPYDMERMGVDFVQSLIKRSCYYYAEKSQEEWETVNYINAQNFTWMALEYDNGFFDPRNRTIVEPERSFDISLAQYDWSAYEYTIGKEVIKGNFGIKGTIDLITKVEDGVYEIVDWKTGSRKNWGTGQLKDYEYLKNDPQLMLYYYAARKLYPEIKEIFFTIFFVRDGGPFTIFFDESHMKRMEDNLRDHFERVKANINPSMIHPEQRDFRCNRLCHFYKNKWPGSDLNICKYIQNEIKTKGMDKTIALHKDPDFKIGYYEEPGT